MRNAWGRPPRNELWNDIQALAIWIFIVGIVGYLLFPDFFHNVYSQLTVSEAETEKLEEITLPSMSSMDLNNPSYDYRLPSVSDALYSGDSEISDGYWAIFVAEGEFKQLRLTADSYTFLLKLIDSDRKAIIKHTLLIAADGKIHKYVVSDEVYKILQNLNIINSRTGNI